MKVLKRFPDLFNRRQGIIHFKAGERLTVREYENTILTLVAEEVRADYTGGRVYRIPPGGAIVIAQEPQKILDRWYSVPKVYGTAEVRRGKEIMVGGYYQSQTLRDRFLLECKPFLKLPGTIDLMPYYKGQRILEAPGSKSGNLPMACWVVDEDPELLAVDDWKFLDPWGVCTVQLPP